METKHELKENGVATSCVRLPLTVSATYRSSLGFLGAYPAPLFSSLMPIPPLGTGKSPAAPVYGEECVYVGNSGAPAVVKLGRRKGTEAAGASSGGGGVWKISTDIC